MAANAGSFKKGEKSPNHGKRGPGKLTQSVKQAFEAAFQSMQGDKTANLETWAKDHPTEFYKIAAKLIPATIAGDPDNPINARVTVEFVRTAS